MDPAAVAAAVFVCRRPLLLTSDNFYFVAPPFQIRVYISYCENLGSGLTGDSNCVIRRMLFQSSRTGDRPLAGFLVDKTEMLGDVRRLGEAAGHRHFLALRALGAFSSCAAMPIEKRHVGLSK